MFGITAYLLWQLPNVLKKVIYCSFFIICLGGEYVTKIVIITIPVFDYDASSIQEFSLELTDFIMFNVASMIRAVP